MAGRYIYVLLLLLLGVVGDCIQADVWIVSHVMPEHACLHDRLQRHVLVVENKQGMCCAELQICPVQCDTRHLLPVTVSSLLGI